MTTTIRPKLKWRLHKFTKFGGKCRDPAGQSGTRYRKKHLQAASQPGTANGTCIKGKVSGARVACQCGKCGA